jgi:hypothetical protein
VNGMQEPSALTALILYGEAQSCGLFEYEVLRYGIDPKKMSVISLIFEFVGFKHASMVPSLQRDVVLEFVSGS